MPCYHPLLGYRDNYALTSSGKKKVRIDSRYDADRIAEFKSDNPHLDVFPVPCGNCIGCRLEYSRQWAIRCMLESKNYEFNYFLTLTYDNMNVPISTYQEVMCDESTGEVLNIVDLDSLTLAPDHLTKFMKDLRRYYEYHFNHYGIRFFACGEYGDRTGRPHYHILIFNLPIFDLELLKKSSSGFNLYYSPTLSQIWDKGHLLIGDVTFQSCAYVARYVVKKHKGMDAHLYSDRSQVAPFVRMSRRPGIASEDYFQNGDKYYKYDELFITDGKGDVLKLKPPKYFDRLYSEEYPEEFELLKSKRKESAENFKPDTDLSPQAYLSVCERGKLKQISSLIREI